MNLYFGDSITEGENNHGISYTDFTNDRSVNLGVSGTTLGEYSIYPVDGHSLLGTIKANTARISGCTHIFIEYGCNDVAAIMCGFATVKTVTVSLVKALDWLHQLNKQAHIHFLAIGTKNSEVIKTFAESECNYLANEYFSDFDFLFPPSKFEQVYFEILDNVEKVCDIIYMFDDNTFSMELLSSDGIHPNTKGHKVIAESINKNI